MSIKNQLQKKNRENKIDGYDMTAPERYAPDTRHMVILKVVKNGHVQKT